MKTVIRNSYTPNIGDYCNTLVIDKETGEQYIFDVDGVWSQITTDSYTKEETDEKIGEEATAREEEDGKIWDKIEEIEMSSDVVDVVGTIADLNSYDTSHLSDNDLIKVLQDSTHGDAISYYRWDKTAGQFNYVGSEGPYYTQTQTNSLLDEKADYTIFYVPASATGPTRHIYKNADMTGEATVQDLIDANNAGAVILRLSTAQYPEDYSDSYLQNAFVAVNNSDYEFVFLDDRSTHNYSADETTDSVFDYYKVDLQAKLTAGTNISINGTTISATDTDTTYSAGTGLSLTGTTFSVDGTIALKSEIPTNVSSLNNDAGYITSAVNDLTNYYTKTETYTQNEVNGLFNALSIPTDTGDLTNGAGYITASDYATTSTGGTIKVGSGLAIDADGVLSATGGGGGPTYTAGTGIDITSDVISVDNTTVPYLSDLATVATTGDYGDLLNKPTIPAAQVNADWNANSGVAQILNKPTIPAAQIQSDWTQADNTKLDYIKNKPTIPVVNDATLTIQHNGTTKATFSSNSSVATTANIETIYADTVAPTATVGAITTANIADGAVTAAKLDVTTVMAAIYPVGSIYMSATMSTAAQVEAAFGGTWVAWGAGRVPVGVDTNDSAFDTVEETGGEKTHTLTTAEMPAHTHPANEQWVGYADSNTWLYIGGGSGSEFQTQTYANSGRTTQSEGGGDAHNNLQPYITCYMYKRTA